MGHDAFRAGVEAQDLAAMVDALSPDVVFHSPITFKPFEGKEAVSTLLGVVASTFEDFRYTDELDGDGVEGARVRGAGRGPAGPGPRPAAVRRSGADRGLHGDGAAAVRRDGARGGGRQGARAGRRGGRSALSGPRLLAITAVGLAAAAAAVVALVGTDDTEPADQPVAKPSSRVCDKVASKPHATVAKLANSLRPGQTGCLRAGVYRGRVKIRRGGAARRADHDQEHSGRARHGARADPRRQQREPRRDPAAVPRRAQPRQAAQSDGQREQRRVPEQRRHDPRHDDLLPARLQGIWPGAPHGDRAQPDPQLRRAAADQPPPRDLRRGVQRRPHHRTTGSTTTRTAACSCSRTRSTPTSPAT